jgi:hypothetical protein
MKKAVIGIVPTETQAEVIVSRLHALGFSSNDISILLPDERGTKEFAHEHHTKAPEAAVAGGSAGGAAGGVLGLLAGLGSLAIPGLGPFIAAGPILAALSGAAVGAAMGGVVGALVGFGIPEYEAKQYEGKLRSGNILVSVHTESAAERKQATDVFRRLGASDIGTQTEASVPSERHAG